MGGILKFLEVISAIGTIAIRIYNEMGEASFHKWLSDLDETTANLSKAKTLKEKSDAARRLADLTRNLK